MRLTDERDRKTSAMYRLCWRVPSDLFVFIIEPSVSLPWAASSTKPTSCARASQSVVSVRKVNDGPSAGFKVVAANAEVGFEGCDIVALFVIFAEMKRGKRA